jgi:cell division initiation protein
VLRVKLTPLDIRRQEFKRVVRGIDPEEVSVFLDMVAGEYERILRENKALGEELEGLKRKVEEFDGMKEAIQGAVVMAKKGADDALSQAKKEAELRLKESEVKAERMLEDARRQAAFIKREMNDIRNQRSILITRMKSLLDGQTKMLEAYMGDWEEESMEMRRTSGAREATRASEGAGAAGSPSWVGSDESGEDSWRPEILPTAGGAEAGESQRASMNAAADGPVGPRDRSARDEEEAAAGERATTVKSRREESLHAGDRVRASASAEAVEREDGEEESSMDDSITSPGRPDLIRFLRGSGPLKPGPLRRGEDEGEVRPLRPPRPAPAGHTGGRGSGGSR